MHSELYWIEAKAASKLAIMARPRSGDWLEDEVAHWKRSGVEIVVSLLEREEIDELDLGAEAMLCEQSGIQYLPFPIPDRDVPADPADAMRFASEIVRQGKTTAIHCRAGIGRSSIMAAAILVCAGLEPADAMSAIQAARRVPIPDTEAQRDWVLKLERR